MFTDGKAPVGIFLALFTGGKAPAGMIYDVFRRKGTGEHKKFFERKNSTMKKLNKKGFTIVELVIVIAVIAILAGVLIPTFASVVTKANQSKAMQEAKNEYEAYLAEYAKDLDGTQDLDIVSGKYYFEVKDGKFDATAKDASTKYSDTASANLVDQSKVYKKTAAKSPAENTVYYTYNDSTKKYEKATISGNTFTPNTIYYEQTDLDLGSANVYIYAVTNP